MVDMKGFIEFEGEKYSFSFYDSRLNLYPKEFNPKPISEWFALSDRGKFIQNIKLHGITSRNKMVMFEVPERYSDDNGFLSFDVYFAYEYEKSRCQNFSEDGKPKYKENNIRGMKFTGIDVDAFYPPQKAYCIELLENKEIAAKVDINKSVEVSLGTIEWKDVEIKFTAQFTTKYSFCAFNPFHSSSEIIAYFSKEVSFDFVEELYFGVYQTFRYIMRRSNIVFKNVEIFDVNEKKQRYIFGKFYDFRINNDNETNSKLKDRVLSYDCIGKKSAELLKKFLEGVIYIDHLPENIDKTNEFGPDRMLFDFVAFEREYANLYPEELVRSKEYIEAKNDTLDILNKLINVKSGKVKEYVKSFHKRISADENSLSDRITKVIKDCLPIMEPFLIYELGKEYNIEKNKIIPLDNMVKKMNILRNDMAHGNLDIKMECEHISGFAILESLLYAMRLKALGIEDEKIQEGIIRIMGYNISLK